MVKHGPGEWLTPEFTSWRGMLARCYSEKAARYGRYGGRGIVVCSRWRGSYQAFLGDMGRRPTPEHSVDRVDGDGHYACGKCQECATNGWTPNCKWSTRKEQQRNRANTRYLEHNGRIRPLSEWAEMAGIPDSVLRARMDKHGMTASEAISTPYQPHRRGPIAFRGESLRLTEWAKRLGLTPSALVHRLKAAGGDVEAAFAAPVAEGRQAAAIRRRDAARTIAPGDITDVLEA